MYPNRLKTWTNLIVLIIIDKIICSEKNTKVHNVITAEMFKNQYNIE